MRLKGAIFDVDGTLLDSMPIWMEAGNRYIKALGKKPEENLGEKLFSMTMTEGGIYLKNTYQLEKSVSEIVEDVKAMVEDFYRNEALLKPGAMEILTWMRSRNMTLTVATSTEEELVKAAFERLEILHFFKEIFTCTKTGAGKNHPLIYENAAHCIGGSHREICVVEDALYALFTAKNAGFYTIGVYDKASQKTQEELKKQADLYGRSLMEIQEKLML